MTKQRKQSLQQKLALTFAAIIACIMGIMLILHIRTINVIRQMTYEKMSSQAEYYRQTFETEIQGILNLQLDFFNNRQLPFLAYPDSGFSAYEEREVVLSVQERIRTITEISSLIQNGFLYIPGSEYYISKGTIRRMEPQDWTDMEGYLQKRGSGLQFDGENFYSIRTGETGNAITKNPQFVFVLTFSNEQVEKNLSVLNALEKGGAFIYNEGERVMLESSRTENLGEEIWQGMEMDDSEKDGKVQRIRINGVNYLALAGESGVMGTFVQYVEEASLTEYIIQSWRYMLLSLVGMVGISAVFIGYTRRIVHKPLNILIQAFEKVKQGNLEEHIYHGTNDEFSYLYLAFNDMEDQLMQLIDEVYVQKNLVQKAQLKQLQAQINPHFLYNSFFILSRRIKRQDYENAEKFAGHLGNYFRYLTRDGSDIIPLRQEAAHAQSYAAIQQARFSNRVRVRFGEVPESCDSLLVPRLIIQPLLENAFGHGLENKVSDGILQVSFMVQASGIQVTVEDNGEEATDADIRKMQEALEWQNPDEVTGIVNIHRRLKIYFHGQAGLVIDRSSLGGVAVTIDIHSDEGNCVASNREDVFTAKLSDSEVP